MNNLFNNRTTIKNILKSDKQINPNDLGLLIAQFILSILITSQNYFLKRFVKSGRTQKNRAIFSVLIIITLLIICQESKAQLGAFRLRGNSSAINIGYTNYRYLTFGIGNNNSQDGKYAIEHWNDGLNIWKPWPSSNPGNYNLFVSDIWKTCVNMKNDNVNSTNYPITNNFQVRGFCQSHGWWVWSDSSLKKDIQALEIGLAKVLQLKPIKYYYKENNAVTDTAAPTLDSVKLMTILADQSRVNPIASSAELRFGFAAQDVQEIFPNLVSDAAEQKSVNYIELIPIMVNAIKEQQEIIENLKDEIEDWKGQTLDSAQVNNSRLFQNTPNPFDGSTTISYYI